MKEQVTAAEAKKMLGVEFTYIFEDGDEIKAYVKAFDPEIGLTCYSLEAVTLNGWVPDSDTEFEADDTYCVIAYDIKEKNHSLTDILERLTDIRDTGTSGANKTGFGGVTCAFM